MASIEIIEKGFYTTIQDRGRRGYGGLGIPESGAMDQQALRMSNLLLNNPINAAALECTLVGPSLSFLKECAFVLTGAESVATLDSQAIHINQVYIAKKGSLLKVGKVLRGCRVYIGLGGGIDTQEYLGSKSKFYPVTPTATVSKRAKFMTGLTNYGDAKGVHLQHTQSLSLLNRTSIQVTKGPEYDFLSDTAVKKLFDSQYTLSSWNRMGIALEEIVTPHHYKMTTGPVMPGTIQIIPSGKLLLLMRDCQTTGGYPRILQLTEEAINILAQKKTSDKISFNL